MKIKPVSDYIIIVPDKPKAGSFDVGSTYIDETGVIESAGPLVGDEMKKLVGKRVLFNAWACDEKHVGKEKVYLAPASANAICAII